ncbi:hypothetical protein V5799_029550 [Amblyomma americanum]|uniref:Uncharacterized protein n=1 Tax=Amblyomma americanum TaxID=6943 RepID=A0AAQ4EQQ1_AMBAM
MSGQRVAQESVHYRDSTPGRDSSKPRRQWTVSEETASRRNRLLKVAASSAALSAPYRFCSHVVVCCGAVDLTWLDVEGAYMGPAAASLKRSHPSVGRIMGIGGPSTNATVLSRALNNTGNLTKLVANIVRTVKRLGFDWGSLVDVRHPELLKKPEKLAHFVRALCLSAARESLQTAVVLPTDPGAEAELHESLRTVNAPRHLTLVKLTDATKLERLGTVPCPVPEKVLDAFEVEQAVAQRPRWFVALSAALAEYGDTVGGDDKAGVRFRRLVSRAELCRGKGWKVRRTGGCVVASSGSLSRVALDPHSDWGSWRKAQGVVIFDMRLDDTRGKCGPPYSFTRSVYFALESHAGR